MDRINKRLILIFLPVFFLTQHFAAKAGVPIPKMFSSAERNTEINKPATVPDRNVLMLQNNQSNSAFESPQIENNLEIKPVLNTKDETKPEKPVQTEMKPLKFNDLGKNLFQQPVNIETPEKPAQNEKDAMPDSNSEEVSPSDAPNQAKMTPDKIDALQDIRNNAKLLYNSNKPAEAQAAFAQIPDSEKISDDWVYLANISQDFGKNEDAVFYLKKAIQADDTNYKAHYNLGNLYLADEKISMALSEYNKAIKNKKDFAFAYYNKGCAYLQRESWFNAKYEFGLAIKTNPQVPSFYYNLAYTYKMMKKDKKAQEALDMYEKLMTN